MKSFFQDLKAGFVALALLIVVRVLARIAAIGIWIHNKSNAKIIDISEYNYKQMLNR